MEEIFAYFLFLVILPAVGIILGSILIIKINVLVGLGVICLFAVISGVCAKKLFKDKTDM